MIPDIYVLAAYNRHVKSVLDYRSSARPEQVIGDMVLLRNTRNDTSDTSYVFYREAVPARMEFVVPEVAYDCTKRIRDNSELVSKFIVSRKEFEALRKDVSLR